MAYQLTAHGNGNVGEPESKTREYKQDLSSPEKAMPLPLAVDKVMRFLEQNAFLHAEFGDIYRKDVWSIPIAPLRELVTNALVHASYSRRGVSIKVAFTDHTIEIENPGGLMPDLTIDEMLQGVSMVRNRAVARVFKELGLIEQWGTGIPQAIQRLADAGLPAPEFKEFGASLRVIVHIKDHSVTPSTVPTDGTVGVPVGGTVETPALLDSERAILGALRVDGSLTAKALVIETGISERQVKRILVKLRERGLLQREGSDRYGRWIVSGAEGSSHAARVGD